MTYQLLTGKLPFRRSNISALLMAHIMEPPPDPRQDNPTLTGPIAAAIQRAMAKNPDQRFNSATEFIEAIQPAIRLK